MFTNWLIINRLITQRQFGNHLKNDLGLEYPTLGLMGLKRPHVIREINPYQPLSTLINPKSHFLFTKNGGRIAHTAGSALRSNNHQPKKATAIT